MRPWELADISNKPRSLAALSDSYHVAYCLFQQILENLLLRALASAGHINTSPTEIPFGVCSAAHSAPVVRALSSA